MWFIHINNAWFKAKHGLYPEEKTLGTEFIVNVKIGFERGEIITLDQTIDYVTVYTIIAKIMAEPTPLLEQVVSIIAKKIKEQLCYKSMFISIKKMNPLFGKSVQSTEVVWEEII